MKSEMHSVSQQMIFLFQVHVMMALRRLSARSPANVDVALILNAMKVKKIMTSSASKKKKSSRITDHWVALELYPMSVKIENHHLHRNSCWNVPTE